MVVQCAYCATFLSQSGVRWMHSIECSCTFLLISTYRSLDSQCVEKYSRHWLCVSRNVHHFDVSRCLLISCLLHRHTGFSIRSNKHSIDQLFWIVVVIQSISWWISSLLVGACGPSMRLPSPRGQMPYSAIVVSSDVSIHCLVVCSANNKWCNDQITVNSQLLYSFF